MLSQVKIIISSFLQGYRWKRSICNRTIMLADASELGLENDRILIIAPHADDELIGCYSIISRYTDNVHVCCCSLTGSNSSVNNKNTREHEFTEFCKALKVNYSILQGRLDKSMEELLLSYKPTVVFLPSFIDWHDEHRLVDKILEDILKKILSPPQVIWYQVSVPISIKAINSYMLLGREKQKLKWKLFGTFYQSQNHLNTRRFSFLEKHTIRSEIAEVFCITTKEQRNSLIEREYLIEEKKDALKKEINNLSFVIQIADELYKEII